MPPRSACYNCRAQKVRNTHGISIGTALADMPILLSQLKCDGQRHGSSRCAASSSGCVYTRHNNRKDRVRKQLLESPIKRHGSVSEMAQAKNKPEGTAEISFDLPESSQTRNDKSLTEKDLSVSQTTRVLGLNSEDVFSDQMPQDLMLDFAEHDVETFLHGPETSLCLKTSKKLLRKVLGSTSLPLSVASCFKSSFFSSSIAT